MDPTKTQICSICQVAFTGWGNNAQPVNNGRCCDKCNADIVIPARLMQIFRSYKHDPDQDAPSAP